MGLTSKYKGFSLAQDQLKFVYDTLEEFVICGKTWFPVSELSSLLKHKSMKDPNNKINEYQKEFLVSFLVNGWGFFLVGVCLTLCLYS